LRKYKFPDKWVDVIELINGANHCVLKDVNKDSQDWNDIELRFKLTMP